MHYPSRVRKAFGPPFLLGITSLGSIALEQFHLIKIPILIVSPTGKSVLEYVTGRLIQNDSPMNFDIFYPLIALDSWVSSPFKVLIFIVVFIPSAFSFLAKSVLINVP